MRFLSRRGLLRRSCVSCREFELSLVCSLLPCVVVHVVQRPLSHAPQLLHGHVLPPWLRVLFVLWLLLRRRVWLDAGR